ncbi:hypothetical protein B5Z22_05400 [Bacillus velezensis]|nr:hypothetical protein B5Z20_00535 [Bacillus velezensis]OQV54856.1 hypothetical protein B5Z22_05400 [Bacillus velezensis]OQV60347.1 hypothetical protein B5Z24_05400 [Bacillus velezensis]OQV61412.1 hypothetical protein B5Z23_05385 [Bacillus velezensis]
MFETYTLYRVEWLPRIDRAEWYYWPRLRNYLINEKMAPKTRSIDRSTDRVFGTVDENVPMLTSSIFQEGVPNGLERIEYDINLEVCPYLVVSTSP